MLAACAATFSLPAPGPAAADRPAETPGPAQASQSGAPRAGTDAPRARFPGLRGLFAVVGRDLEVLLVEAGPPAAVLGSPAERDAALERVPAGRREQAAVAHALAVGRWAEFQRVVAAVLGSGDRPLRFRFPERAADLLADLPAAGAAADGAALARDRLVQRMVALGHGPLAIADVVSGRLPLAALRHAGRLRLLGRSEREITRYLEEQAQAEARRRAEAQARPAALGPAPPPPRPGAPRGPGAASGPPRRPPASGLLPADPGPPRGRHDAAVVRAAARHRLDPDLVRAVIRHESGWNPAARSPKGALGLMQLMPSTARLLGVDPLDPEDNIEGGTRYLASLLALFDGDLDAALVGYVAGPGYARDWLRGRRPPANEVSSYLDSVRRTYGEAVTRRRAAGGPAAGPEGGGR